MLSIFKRLSVSHLEDEAMKRAICRVIDRRSYYGFSSNTEVREFEAELSSRLDNAPVIGVNSGTDALIIALKVLSIGPGDEVIVPAFSFISTASPICWVGARPVFVDVRFEDYAIDSTRIEERITRRTKAIVVAHLFGQPATGFEEILAVAKSRSIPVIEDAAQAFGAKVMVGGIWRAVGTLGDFGCFSFSSTKPLAAPGSGGALTVKDPGLREEAGRMRSYGARQHYRDYPTIGVNSKLQEMQAAALRARLPFFDHWLEHRRTVASRYAELLGGVGDVVAPREESRTKRTWYRYVIRTKKRDALATHLRSAAGSLRHLQPTVNYPVPLPYLEAFGNEARPGDFPVAEEAAASVISLPIANVVSLAEAEAIAAAVRQFYRPHHAADHLHS